MKKFITTTLLVVFSIGLLAAQDPFDFLPYKKGGQIVYKSYNANHSLIATTTYTVLEDYDYSNDHYLPDGYINMNYTITNASGAAIDRGKTSAKYEDGAFFFNMSQLEYNMSDMMDYIGAETSLLGSFLDYPDTFSNNRSFEGEFKMEGAEFTLKSKSNKEDFVTVSIRNRDFVRNEAVAVPLGTLEASKITFEIEVYRNLDESITTYKANEWYKVDKGIIKTEIYDSNNNLINYTVLAEMKN